MHFAKEHRWSIAFAILVVVPLAVFSNALRCDFINYDDPSYVTQNWIVQRGLSVDGIVWAFKTPHAGNWHPVTWLSHMVDCEISGLTPTVHHFTNLLLHVANAALLFWLLTEMTGAFWRSLGVAALFALHPMHVESVAWVSERKDVLSTFFGLLSILFYFRYVQRGAGSLKEKGPQYALSLGFFALSLMSKPMLVTMPFLLLLLDYWPLRRLPGQKSGGTSGSAISRLILEKVPFLVLTVASIFITLAVQTKGGAVATVRDLPLLLRVENALVAYALYVVKLVWPAKLALIYPYQKWSGLAVAGAVVLLVGLTFVAVTMRKRHPAILTGWLIFLGTLVPVIGLVQVGVQSMANRYTYLPYIGLFVALVWGLSAMRNAQQWFPAALALAVAGCAVATKVELGYWRNSETIFRRALAVTSNNFVAHNNLAHYLLGAGRAEEAIAHLERVLNIKPDYVDARNNLASAYITLEKYKEAIATLDVVLKMAPNHAEAHYNVGKCFQASGQLEEAVSCFAAALKIRPDFLDAQTEMGISLFQLGKLQEAKGYFETAVQLNPRSPEAHNNLANLFKADGKPREAARRYLAAVKLRPGYANAHYNLADVYLNLGENQLAAQHYTLALRINPRDADALYGLGEAWFRARRAESAIKPLNEALRLKPDFAEALIRLAWIRATFPDAKLRNGEEAIKLVERAAALRPDRDPELLSTLGVSYAEAGKFDEAVKNAEMALSLAKERRQQDFETRIQAQLSSFRAGKAFRDQDYARFPVSGISVQEAN